MAQIIRVYSTEADAVAGGDVNMIVSQSVDGNAGGIANLHTDNDDIPYFIHTRFFYRIDANEPVSEFHIDWDDGENNSPEKHNIQIIKNDKPTFFTVVDHVFTEACTETKKFFPMVRVKSIDGFLSKWYTNDAAENVAHASTKALETFSSNLGIGQNLTSVLSFEKAGKDLIPHFCPSNLPPVAILKVDRKRIIGGIDNRAISSIEAGGTTWPLLYAYIDTSVAQSDWPSVKLTTQGKHDRAIREFTLTYTNLITSDSDLNSSEEIASSCVPYNLDAVTTTGLPTESVEVLLRAELTNATALGDDDRIYIKVFNAVNKLSGTVDVSDDATVCILSNGNPIVDLNEPAHSVLVDTSESFARASNINIKNSYIDDDTLNNSTIQSQAAITSKQGNISDEFHDDLAVTSLSDSYSNTQLSYTHDNKGHLKDSDNRFYPFHRLIRAQVRDDYILPTGMGDISNRRSFVEHYDDDQYESTVTSGPLRIPENIESRGLLLYSNHDVAEQAIWRDLTTLYKTNETMVGGSGTYKLRYAPDTTVGGITLSNHPKNHILLCKSDLFDRIYFRLDNSYIDSDAASNVDITIHYAHQNGWKPLEIKDETLGMKTSAGIKFKVPPDWKKMAYDGIESGLWTGPCPSSSSTVAEITTFLINSGDDRARIDGEYVVLYEPATSNKNVFWFDSTGSTTEPVVSGSTTSTKVDISISSSVTAEVTSVTVNTDKDDIAKLANTYIVFSRAGNIATPAPDIKDVFWFKIDSSGTEPDSNDLITRHADITGSTTINKTEVDVQGMVTDVAFATELKDEIHANANYTATRVAAAVTVTHATADDILDAYEYHDPPATASIIFSMITQGVADNTGTDEFFASTLRGKINGHSEYSAVVASATVTVTHEKGGAVTDATDSDAQITTTITRQGAASAGDPSSLWDFDAYAILISINAKDTNSSKIRIKNIWPFNNSHSQLIKITDGHHVSLNNIAISQSISFERRGSFVNLNDRFGRTEIRKLGASGGVITFGGVDLGDTDGQGNRKKIKTYQQKGTPVFLDVTHKSGEATRFFGVITKMSEDHPAGKLLPKYALQMQVSYLIELDSSGNLLTDKISIGGSIGDTRQYISTS